MTGNKKYSLPALKQIVKGNNIKGTSIMNKPEILNLLIEKGLVPNEALTVSQAKPIKNLDSIRNNPKRVLVKDSETGIETEYSSIYRASRATGLSTSVICSNNGKTWNEKYSIKVY